MTKLLWLDMEMTGLDVEKEVPIEVAAIITDLDFRTLDTYHAVIRQPQKFLDGMDDWNKRTHGDSGLTAKVPTGKDSSDVQTELIAMINKHFAANDRPVLAGNSIHQDRLFIDHHLKKLSARLHYRMLDVSSWKIIMNSKYNIKYEKKNSHQALEDIQESIQELKAYIGHIKV